MARRYTPEKREVSPDVRYGKLEIQEMINRIMIKGKKSTATRLMYDALELVEDRTGKDPVETFDAALKNVSPLMEVRPRRVGGATYQVPMEVEPSRRKTLAMRWIIAASRARSGKSFAEKLAGELMDAATNQGAAYRRREEAHRMAEANRAFSHFRL
ncbi:MAG TPA: 30S ribosomal protein S7 [Anaerolineaceae bacterium]|jgi:small subunit ribosomal protein S7|nr:30S ribosomal protein S7 [Anaerolineaceae bacterium]